VKTILIKLSKLALLLAICLSPIFISAQDELNNKKSNAQNREARKIAYFTSKMQLNSKESQNFWPIVNEMEAEIKGLKDANAHGRMMLKGKEEISDKELEEIMDSRIQMSKDMIDIKIKYHEKFKEVLPIKKVAKYYEATKDFKKIQSERKKQHKDPGNRAK
jgi:hypothetical protein